MTQFAAVAAILSLFVISGPSRLSGASAAELFDSSHLQRIDLNLNTQDWLKLKENFQSNKYYPADLTWNGETVHNTGVRSRGVASRSGVKPGLRVDFAQYATDQTFLGLKALVLDNLLQDPSGIHETVTNWMYTQMGIGAAREAHARLYVNGEFAGLYALIEPVDKTMLARLFGSDGEDVLNDGYLYEFKKVGPWDFTYLGSDLAPYKAYFEAKTHETRTDEDLYRPIETMMRLIQETPDSDLPAALEKFMDVRGLIRYLAVQNFLAENDGFLGEFGVNNFYLYRLEHSEQHVLIPWDDDLSFHDPQYDLTQRFRDNALMRKLMQNRDLYGLYLDTLMEAVDRANKRVEGAPIGALEEEIRRQVGVIDSSMFEDTFKPWTDTDYTTNRDLMIQFSRQRINYVSCEVMRLYGRPGC